MSKKILEGMFLLHLKTQGSWEDQARFLHPDTLEPKVDEVKRFIEKKWERLLFFGEQLGYDRITDKALATNSLAKVLQQHNGWIHYEAYEVSKSLIKELSDGTDA